MFWAFFNDKFVNKNTRKTLKFEFEKNGPTFTEGILCLSLIMIQDQHNHLTKLFFANKRLNIHFIPHIGLFVLDSAAQLLDLSLQLGRIKLLLFQSGLQHVDLGFQICKVTLAGLGLGQGGF